MSKCTPITAEGRARLRFLLAHAAPEDLMQSRVVPAVLREAIDLIDELVEQEALADDDIARLLRERSDLAKKVPDIEEREAEKGTK